MKKLLGLDHTYQQLKQLNLFGSDFQQMPFCSMRKFVKSLSIASNQDDLLVILSKLRSQNKSSYDSIKALIFYNLLLNQFTVSSKMDINQLIKNQVNKITTLQKDRYEKIHRSRNTMKQSSLQKSVNWLKQRLSRSKDKTQKRNKKSYSYQHKMSSVHNLTVSEVTQNTEPEQNQVMKQGKQQLLISKILLPYASYLLKLTSSQVDYVKNAIKPHLRSEQIWKIINLLKSLLKTSDSFPTILRYYNQQYYNLIFSVIKSIDYELKVLYPILQRSLTAKCNLIQKQAKQIYQKSQGSIRKAQLLQGVIFKFQLEQFKQILYEVAAINQSIITIYLGKLTYVGIMDAGIRQPILFVDQAKSQLVHSILRQVQRRKTTEKRLSQQKQKSKLMNSPVIKFGMKTEVSQTLFGQKKSKLLAEMKQKGRVINNRQTQKKKQRTPQKLQKSDKKQDAVGNTFRKFRLNMTQPIGPIQDSNTKRIRQ